MTTPDTPKSPFSGEQLGRVAAPLREQVVELLRQAILDFRYSPGERLIERELIEQIGVSRTTIREVLRQLEVEGLVTTIPQKGAIVTAPTPAEARDLYEVRAALEGLAVRLFVQRANPELLAELRGAYESFAELVSRGGDIHQMLQAKDAIYGVLVRGGGNGSIGSILGTLQARVRRLRAASLSQPGRPEHAVDEIRQLVEAAERGDADAAAVFAVEHIENASDSGLEALTHIPGPPTPSAIF
jgi:GntR family transcriptional regulator, trigonelline degradation regulator